MVLNFIKKPYIFALYLSLFILPLTTIAATHLSLYPKIIVALLIFTIGSYIYTRIFQFKFSTEFLIKTLLWHSIYVIILPTLVISLLLGRETIWKFIKIFLQTKTCWIIPVFFAILSGIYLLTYLACWLGNKIGMKYAIIGEKSIKKFISSWFALNKPFTFAIVFFLLLLCTKDVFILIFDLIRLTISNIAVGLFMFFLIPVFAGVFSFAYTYFYQMQMTKKFKVRAIANTAIILLIFAIFLILKNPMLKSHFLWSNDLAYEISKFVTTTSLSPFTWIILLMSYFCITYGNKFALRFFKANQTNVSIEA